MSALADNYGHADVMRGWIDGDRLTFESLGQPAIRPRLVWDRSNPERMIWRNEISIAAGPWSLVEEYHCTPSPRDLAQRLDDLRPLETLVA
jgi:hypothetical protein